MALDLGVIPTGEVEIHVSDRQRCFGNVVLDQGWASLLSRADGADGDMVPRWLSFGLGEGDPDPAQTGLEQRVNATDKQATSVAYGGFVNASSLTAYSEAVVRFDYAAGELTGDEWVELGLAYGSAYTEPYNRALIRDENGVPTPLVVMSYEPVTVYVRLRLNMKGWGSTVDLSDYFSGLSAVMTVDPSVASDTTGLWLKGFPLIDSRLGGTMAQYRVASDAQSSDFLFHVPPRSTWSANRVTFMARAGAEHVHYDLNQDLVKPWALQLDMRFRINITRG